MKTPLHLRRRTAVGLLAGLSGLLNVANPAYAQPWAQVPWPNVPGLAINWNVGLGPPQALAA
jgi:hypothetical protein